MGGVVGLCALILCAIGLTVYLRTKRDKEAEAEAPTVTEMNSAYSTGVAPPSNYAKVPRAETESNYTAMGDDYGTIHLPVSSDAGSVAGSMPYGKFDVGLDQADDGYRQISVDGWK